MFQNIYSDDKKYSFLNFKLKAESEIIAKMDECATASVNVRWPSNIICLGVTSYILKADVLDVRTPQKIQIFRRKIVRECENYQSQSLKANNSAMCYK